MAEVLKEGQSVLFVGINGQLTPSKMAEVFLEHHKLDVTYRPIYHTTMPFYVYDELTGQEWHTPSKTTLSGYEFKIKDHNKST